MEVKTAREPGINASELVRGLDDGSPKPKSVALEVDAIALQHGFGSLRTERRWKVAHHQRVGIHGPRHTVLLHQAQFLGSTLINFTVAGSSFSSSSKLPTLSLFAL
jgi:hypothetical protein